MSSFVGIAQYQPVRFPTALSRTFNGNEKVSDLCNTKPLDSIWRAAVEKATYLGAPVTLPRLGS